MASKTKGDDVTQHTAEQLFILGFEQYQLQNYTKAVKYCKKAADSIFHNNIASYRQISGEGLAKSELIEIQLKKAKKCSVNTYF